MIIKKAGTASLIVLIGTNNYKAKGSFLEAYDEIGEWDTNKSHHSKYNV